MMSKPWTDWRRAARVLLAGLVTIAGLFSLGAQPGSTLHPAERKPSIIFILADDLGYGDLGCYGQAKIKTPNLDRLAAEGMRFTSFYAGSTVCAPSRCALMTGLHTGHALIRGNALVPLGPQDLTVAELLKQAGYRTALIGKWGLGNPGTTGVPQKKGFDEFLGYLDQVHAHDYYTDYLWRYDPRTDAKPGFDGRVEFPENRDGKMGMYMDDLFDSAALHFVSNNKPELAQSLPALLPLPGLHHSACEQRGRPAHRQRHGSPERRSLFRPAVAADGKEQGRHDHAAGHLRRPAPGQAQGTEDRREHGRLLRQRQRPA